MAVYFSLPFEPNIYAPFLIAGLAALCLFAVYRRRADAPLTLTLVLSLILLFIFGFFYSAGYARTVNTKIIPRDVHGAIVSGTVTGLDYTPARVRIFMDTTNVTSVYYSNAESEQPVYKVRLSANPEKTIIPNIGDTIVANGGVFRPGPAAGPGGFDFTEWAYHNGLSGAGFADKIEIIGHAQNTNTISHLRDRIHSYISANASPRGAMLSDALILGYRRVLPDNESDSAKASGIAHVFSISGFHLTLIGGWIFAFFYFLFRSVAPLSRRFPVRNMAIVPTVILLTFYLVLSGGAVATQRALMMAGIGFLALIFARNVFSLRGAAIVFGALLLSNPHYVTQVGFQLSFSAVFGIIWYFQARKYEHKTRAQKFYDGLKVLFMTSVVATIFTTPYIAYHFYNVPVYTLVGNLLCLPIFSFAIMPLVLIGTITAGFGVFFPLELAGHAYGVSLAITDWIRDLPFAMTQTPTIPGPALGLFTLSLMCWIFIIDDKIKFSRYAAAFFATLAALITVLRPTPIFYASADNRLVAFMTDDGKLQFNKGRSSGHRMTFDSWEKSNFTSAPEKRRPIGKGFTGQKYSVSCQGKVCIYDTPKWKLAYIQQFVPLATHIGEICNSPVDFIVTPWRISAPNCDEQILSGGLVIYRDGTVKRISTNRIWHR